jgi:hypothetical protein
VRLLTRAGAVRVAVARTLRACRELLRGPLIYVAAMVFATVVFWRNSPVGVVAISLMCGGDGARGAAAARVRSHARADG